MGRDGFLGGGGGTYPLAGLGGFMLIKELQLLSQSLWNSVEDDLKFFSSIKSFVKNLSDFDYVELDKGKISELLLYINKIEEFFNAYRPSPNSRDLYIPPAQTSNNDSTVKRIFEIINKLNSLSSEDLQNEINQMIPRTQIIQENNKNGYVFIGHGGNKLWARVQIYLKDELKLQTMTFEDQSHTSESIVPILEGFLSKAIFAVMVLTAEDETIDGKARARQNVIHESGLFQGRIGFKKVVLLKQDNIEEFTNVAGLQYISFNNDNIDQTFYELGRVLKREGLIK